MTRGKVDQRAKIKQMEKNYTKMLDHVRKRLNWFKLFYKS